MKRKNKFVIIVKYGDTVTIKVEARNYINQTLTFMLRESVFGFDKKLDETIDITINSEGKGENTFTIPESWKDYGDPCIVRKYYLEEKETGDEFPRSYYVANPNKTEEENKKNSRRIEALMLKVTDDESLYATEEKNNAVILGEELKGGADGDCKGTNCIRLGEESELIQEINIRLAGFGGNIPTKKFTPRTSTMIKQFQKDYMEIEPTGNICGDTLKAIDEFSENWGEEIKTYKCLCHASDSKVKKEDRCPGYGKGKKNEHPGMHRSLLWGVSALKFYLSKQDSYKYRRTSAGYRCWAHNNSIPRKSTNHMGKAVDIQFNKGDYIITQHKKQNIPYLKEIASTFYKKKLKAEEGWSIPSKNNKYRLEPIGTGKDNSYSWIHMDVSLYKEEFLKDEFFTENQSAIIGKKIVDIAKEVGFKNTCDCLGGYTPKNKTATSTIKCETCTTLEKRRIEFYNQVGESSINFVNDLSSANKFKGLYMVAQRRQENGFHLVPPGNNPMNIKGKGDLGQVELNTHEYINGKRVNMKDGFDKFTTMEKGFEGYANLLDKNFNNAYLALKDDSKTIDDFLKGLQDEGKIGSYATDPNYKSSIKTIFIGVVKDYKKWLNCKLSCGSFNKEDIGKDIKLLEKLK